MIQVSSSFVASFLVHLIQSGAVPVSDGDYGDIVVSGDGSTWTIDPAVLSAVGRALIAAANAADQRAALGLGSAALMASGDFAAAGHTHAELSGLASMAYISEASLKGGAATLADRLGCMGAFASANAAGFVSGQYYDNSFQGSASGTLAGVANRLDLGPFYTAVPLSIDRIGVSVSTGVASATGKIVIYSADANGWPDVLLYESADLSFAAAAFVEATLSFTFSSNVRYWLGVRHNSTATLRTVAVASAVNLGLTSNNAANYATILRRTVTYANAAPSPWVFTNADRVANVTPPSIRFRAV